MTKLLQIRNELVKNFLKRVRKFDRRFLKPLFMREKFISRDEKLLSTFKKINELNLTKMAEENPEFVSNETPQVNIIDSKPSNNPKENAKIRDFLENAMHDPNRTVNFVYFPTFLLDYCLLFLIYSK